MAKPRDGRMKYIVKNCPALLISGICNGRNVKGLACKNNTDCLIKQVIEKCKYDTYRVFDEKTKKVIGYRQSPFAQELLQLFEIEECE